MDTSEQNIKMCGKAEEIQALWIPTIGDYCIHPEGAWCDKEGWVVTQHFDIQKEVEVFRGTATTNYGSGVDWRCHNVERFKKEDCIWLPHQDQLQKMVIGNYVSPRKMFIHFGHYNTIYADINYSAEKLWLAFVMLWKYHKEWKGEAWIDSDLL